MKIFILFSWTVLIASCASAEKRNYTGSTPADITVRSFLGIPLSDSIDFIRWQLALDDNNYVLNCNYGIGKPNTNGFINGGKNITIHGIMLKEENYYQLRSGDKTLELAALNENLLHIMKADKSLLVGNGGWSYTLNNIQPIVTDQITLKTTGSVLKDSMVFDGRTPCDIPGVIPPGTACYKIKWRIILYADPLKQQPVSYKILGTPWRNKDGRRGSWSVNTGKKGTIIYQLNDENGKGLLYLLKPDEHILIFTDSKGNTLTGNGDFSYTLNKISTIN